MDVLHLQPVNRAATISRSTVKYLIIILQIDELFQCQFGFILILKSPPMNQQLTG